MDSEIPPSVKEGGTLRYMPQLDALRALAVGLVFLSHWGGKTGITRMLGVRLFFVISGFLIAVSIASVSWFAWERPLTGLRKYIRYEGVPLQTDVASETPQ